MSKKNTNIPKVHKEVKKRYAFEYILIVILACFFCLFSNLYF